MHPGVEVQQQKREREKEYNERRMGSINEDNDVKAICRGP